MEKKTYIFLRGPRVPFGQPDLTWLFSEPLPAGV